MEYFDLIPDELLTLIIFNLDYYDFISFYDFVVRSNINYSILFYDTFGYIKHANIDVYKKFLGIKDLRYRLKLSKTIEELNSENFLNLSNKDCKEMPESLGELAQITELNLSRNKLKIVPRFIGKLTNLRELFLNHTKLKIIPNFIGNLLKLTYLDLSYNNLTHLPDFVLKLPRLTRLNVVNNSIESPDLQKLETNITIIGRHEQFL